MEKQKEEEMEKEEVLQPIVVEGGMKTIKCMVVGETGVGKTCLILSYYAVYCDGYRSTGGPELHPVDVINEVDDHPMKLKLWDTPGPHRASTFRTPYYRGTNVFIICFSITSPKSLRRVLDSWHPEVTLHCPGVPFLLVGTKMDLRDDAETVKSLGKWNVVPTSQLEGYEMAEMIGAVKYMECSAKTQKGVSDVFDEAIQAVTKTKTKMKMKKNKNKNCTLY